MKTFLEKLQEDAATHLPVVMAFGRMNPPTIGHEKLVNRVKQIAKDYNAPHHIILSHSVDAKKNPLAAAAKVKHAKRFFPGANIETATKEKPTFLQHAAALHQAGHDHLVMVAGSDRIPEYEKKLHQYNGEGPGKLFNFKKIEVKSAGHRDPDAEGAEGMSASKMREHAKNNDFISFKQGVPPHVPEKHAKELFRDVRKGMGLNEEHDRGMFKAIFVTGGPGSGKDIIIRESIAEQKAVEITSPQAYNYLMDKQALSQKSNDLRRESIRNRKPLIINGPADDHTRMITVMEELEELGYSTVMVFVDTTNETSQIRNEKLTKMVAENVRHEKWALAQVCKESYRQNFKNFINLNNSGTLEEIEEDITDIYQEISNFIDDKSYMEEACRWMETHGKLNTNNSITVLTKENNNVKENSRFIHRLKESRKPRLTKGTGGNAENFGDITPDNRASEPKSDDIKWNAGKRRGSYTFRTYSEENQAHIQKFPEPKEKRFNKDKESIKKKGLKDAPTVNQRLRNQSGIGAEFDTRQQGTVYPMSGLGDVTYRESTKTFGNLIKEFNGFINDVESGVGGTLGGADNKEPMENPKNKMGYTYDTIKNKKKNGVKK